MNNTKSNLGALNDYYQTYFDGDTIQKRILRSNLSDDDKIFLIEKLAEKSNWPSYPSTPWNPGPIYCRSTAANDDEYLTERCCPESYFNSFVEEV